MQSKRRNIKKTLYSLIALIILWIGIFMTDYMRCASLKEPLFVIASNNVQDHGESGTYYGLGYIVKVEKEVNAKDGMRLLSVEMWMFNKVIAASIQ